MIQSNSTSQSPTLATTKSSVITIKPTTLSVSNSNTQNINQNKTTSTATLITTIQNQSSSCKYGYVLNTNSCEGKIK